MMLPGKRQEGFEVLELDLLGAEEPMVGVGADVQQFGDQLLLVNVAVGHLRRARIGSEASPQGGGAVHRGCRLRAEREGADQERPGKVL